MLCSQQTADRTHHPRETMPRAYTTDMKLLCRALQLECPFLMQLPTSARLYRPIYNRTLYLVGDLILFAPASTELGCVFLAQVKDVEWRGERESSYDVVCIGRPDGRGDGTMVNQITKVKIVKNSIICELVVAE